MSDENKLTAEEVQSYVIPGLPALNLQQTNFFVAVMNGQDPKQAWMDSYYDGTQDLGDVYSKVCKIRETNWFKSYKQYYLDICRQRQLNTAAWNLELSILERRRLYSLNLVEVERLAQAHDKAIAYWTRKKEEAIERDDEKAIDKYEEKIIKELKSKNMAIASNQACQDALEGLDKLMGLQTVNVNHTGQVSFVGSEDMWGDDY